MLNLLQWKIFSLIKCIINHLLMAALLTSNAKC